MTAHSALRSLAESLYSAIHNEKYLPNIKYKWRSHLSKDDDKDVIRERRPTESDCEVYHFPQMWGSTALGFGGMGGAMMSEAYTTIVRCENTCAIFFDGRHAYTVPMSDQLRADIMNHRVSDVAKSKKYLKE